MKCLNINNPQILSELNKLTSILGDANAAYAVLALNNGYGLDKAPNGLDSKLLLDLIILFQSKSAPESDIYNLAIKEKAKFYSVEFLERFGDWTSKKLPIKVDINGEPLLSETNYSIEDFKIINSSSLRLELLQQYANLLNPNLDIIDLLKLLDLNLSHLDHDERLRNLWQLAIAWAESKGLYIDDFRLFVSDNNLIKVAEGSTSEIYQIDNTIIKIIDLSVKHYGDLVAFLDNILLLNYYFPNGSYLNEIYITYDTKDGQLTPKVIIQQPYIETDDSIALNTDATNKWFEEFYKWLKERGWILSNHNNIAYKDNVQISDFGPYNAKKISNSPLDFLIIDIDAEFTIKTNSSILELPDTKPYINTVRHYDDGVIEIPILSQDTKDILSLQQYQYSIEGLTLEEIQDRQRAYLSQDPDEVQRVRKFLELIQVRQALLHTFNKDFGEELYINGVFDWNNYLLGIDLRKDITENQDLSAFSPIVDYTVDPAEIIMPKLYKTQFKLGTKDIADIDLNFFKRANPFYKSDLKSEGIPVDYLVRGHNFAYNVVVQDTLLFDHGNWKPITPRIEDGWRLDNSGNRMYQVPEECKFALYINPKGQETLVILNEGLSDNYIKTIIETTNNRVSVHPFFENLTPTKSKLLDVVKWNHITTINGALKNLSRLIDLMGESQIQEALNDLYIKRERQYKNDLANTLYNSFVKTLYLVSVRIPTQDFQSIMATKVVGLTNDDSNNVFVTRWLFWLQGSDLDIDKTYLMGADISPIGTYNHWSPLADYTSPELAKLSDELPLPNGKVILAPNEVYKAQGDYITIEFAEILNNPIDIALWNTYDDDETNYKKLRLETVVALLKEVNRTGKFIMSEQLYQDPLIKHIIDLINKHNTHNITAAESRNIIQSLILKASLDERNMRASYSPIDVVMDKFKNVLNQIDLNVVYVPKIEYYSGYWTREEIEALKDKVFLFGDNTDDRVNTHYVPTKTQAVIRGLDNAIGVDTKKDRKTNKSSYFTDADFNQFKILVDQAIAQAIATGKTIVIPSDGIGTGKAELPTRAPKLYAYLLKKLSELSKPIIQNNYKSLDDGGRSIAMMQYNNSVGKKDVGIMANGLKAFFALTQYFNLHKNDPEFINSNRYFLSKISLGQGQDKYFSTISDIKFEEYGLQMLKSAFQTFLPDVALTSDLTFNADDASLLISSLVSLATD